MPRQKSPITIALEPIAAKSGLSMKHLRELHHAGMPIISTAAALRWLSERPDDKPATSSVEALRLGRLKLVNAQAEKAQLELAARRGEFILRSDVESEMARAGQAVGALLRSLETTLPPLVFGKNPMEVRGVIHKELIKTMSVFRSGEAEFWKSHPESE